MMYLVLLVSNSIGPHRLRAALFQFHLTSFINHRNLNQGLLHRALPKEIFDPNGHAMDTTYLDVDLRIVRFTGVTHEGVRNIFMRQGSIVINPAGPV